MTVVTKKAWKNVRKIEEAFCGESFISRSEFEALTAHLRNRKYFRQSVRRMVDGGFLVETKSHIALTVKGFIRFHAKYKIKTPNHWDGKWRIISFDVPEKNHADRDRLRYLLRDSGFYQLQRSVWLCPNFIGEKVWKLIVELGLHKYCTAMLAELFEGDSIARTHFNLGPSKISRSRNV